MTNIKTTSKINKQREIEKKKRKKRKKIIRLILLVLVIAIICAYLLTAEEFKIKEITIEGNKHLTEKEICELSETKIGDNIFSVLEIVKKVKLKQNGYIEDVKIEKTYPNKIKIQIAEREAKYQILTETGSYIYIDEQGYILESSLDKLEIVTITGMEITEEKIKEIKRLEEKDLEKMENILQIKEETKEIEIDNRIQQIDTKDDEYIVHLDNDTIIINLGDATNLKNRMFYVKAILKEENEASGIIYVNGNLNEGFMPYFRAN